MMRRTPRTPTGRPRLSAAHKAGLAGLVGTTVEWYDFFVFSTASSLVFPELFFPGAQQATGLLASFATFWVGFLGRPVGAALFGHLGDRLGRKRSLVGTLLLMGAATTGIGLLPSYDEAGVTAPVLLCVLRLVQGIAVGGEWGGAVLLAGEHAPKGRRVILTAMVQQGTPLASILTSAVFIPFSRLGDGEFLAWGWRVPFLLATVLMAVGLVIRLKVPESPEFEGLSAQGRVAPAPVRDTLRRHFPKMAVCVGACAVPVAGTYLAGTFVLSWATVHIGFPREKVLGVVLCAAVARFVVQPVAALAAQRLGAARICALGLAMYVLAIPLTVLALGSGSLLRIALGVCALESASAVVYAVVAALLVDAFPVRVRYTAISLAQQLAGVVFGGTAPALAQALVSVGHGSLWPVALYQAFLAALSACCLPALTSARRAATAAAHPRQEVADAPG
ncbi:MFS transporter [Streptomyces lydicus]|uniref:MFS transporter n=1 Tax=Streptomyces lydicus TaxID=47763 RepID=UPI0019D6DF85|nr:MFS transporter [Streptomyces lydicus]MCZ1010827.1 MFS transporter [Streptomyces lydicus]